MLTIAWTWSAVPPDQFPQTRRRCVQIVPRALNSLSTNYSWWELNCEVEMSYHLLTYWLSARCTGGIRTFRSFEISPPSERFAHEKNADDGEDEPKAKKTGRPFSPSAKRTSKRRNVRKSTGLCQKLAYVCLFSRCRGEKMYFRPTVTTFFLHLLSIGIYSIYPKTMLY